MMRRAVLGIVKLGRKATGQPKSVSGYIGAGYVAWRAP